MKVLIYGLNFWPEEIGIGKYSGEMAAWLAARGHDVRVICAPPYYPDWKVRAGYSGWRFRREQWQGVDVRRCPIWVPAKVSGLKRILHLASFAIASLPEAVRAIAFRPDVVFVLEPPLFCAPAAVVASRLSGAKAWLHVQDFEVDAALDLGILKFPGLRQLAVWAERWILRRFDVCSTISPRMIDRLRQKSNSAQPLVLFPNWVDGETVFPLQHPSSFRTELNLASHQLVALYSGNMGGKQGLETVIEAARLLQHRDDFVFVMCGNGAGRENLQQLASGLPNVRWLPLQPLERLNELLNLADVHLLPQKAEAADLVMPSKLTGMLASGRPVLATALPGTQVHAVVEKVGVNVPPGNAAAFAAGLEQLLSQPAERLRFGAAARTIAVEELGRERILNSLERQFQQLTSNQPMELA